MKIEPDMWLSGVLQHPAFRVSLPDHTDVGSISAVTAESLTACARSGSALFYAKLPTVRVDQARALATMGFGVVDVNVTFEREPSGQSSRTTGSSVVVRKIRLDECDRTLDIAESCFLYSRFHLDPQLSKEVGNKVKRAWVNSYCNKTRGECLYVAELDGNVVGFNAVLRTMIRGKTVRAIDLIGVDKACQGRGVGKTLVEFFIQESAGQADSLRVGTQVANVPSMRLYERCGFSIVESAYVMHAHVRDGEVVR